VLPLRAKQRPLRSPIALSPFHATTIVARSIRLPKNKIHFNKISARSAVHASTKLKPIVAIEVLQECATK
jgi:hypothetical protein